MHSLYICSGDEICEIIILSKFALFLFVCPDYAFNHHDLEGILSATDRGVDLQSFMQGIVA